MRKARVLVLMLAVFAAAASIMLVRNAGSRNAAISLPIETIDVLVAARSFKSGETITRDKVKWQPRQYVKTPLEASKRRDALDIVEVYRRGHGCPAHVFRRVSVIAGGFHPGANLRSRAVSTRRKLDPTRPPVW